MKKRKKIIVGGAVALILIAAFLFRINFLLRYHQAPVVWDAAGYNIQAKEFAKAFAAWPAREAFITHFKKAYEMALPKCELYPFFLSVVYLIRGVDFESARISQAILGTLSILLLYLISVRLFNRQVALITILVAAFYIPLVISEGRLLTETLAIFVFMLANWLLVLALDRGSWWLILLSGLATALMVITRAFFQYIYLLYWPMLVAGLVLRRTARFFPKSSSPTGKFKWTRLAAKSVRWFPLKSLLFILGLVIIIVPRLFWTPRIDRHHRSWISGSQRNGMAMYCGVYPPNRGLQTVGPPGGEILRSVKVERKPGAVDEKYFKAYLQILLRKPAEALPVLLAKGWLFYQRAYNDFLQSYILPPSGIDIFNRVFLIMGLFGIALLTGLGPRAWPVVISLIYGWAMCFLADAESRYILPLIPLMIMAGVWFGQRLVLGLAALLRKRGRSTYRCLVLLLISSFLFGLSVMGRPCYSMMTLPGLTFITAHYFWVFFSTLFILSLIPLLFIVYRSSLSGWRRLFGAAFPSACILLVYLSAIKVHPNWHEWKIRLDNQDQVIRQTIALPAELRKYRSVDLKLDLVSGVNRWYDMMISIDGEIVRHFEGGLSPDSASWVPPVIRRAFPIYLRETKRKISDLRQWYTVPLDLKKLEGKSSIEVEVRFIPAEEADDCYVDLFGDYRVFDDPGIFEGPTLSKSPDRLSIYKYLIDDDWRIWETTLTALTSGESYMGPGRSRGDDLSSQPGIQSGIFRILLLLSKRKPPPSGFPVAVKHQEYLTDKSLLADYYNLQIWEVNPWKRKSNHMLLEAAHAAPGEEGGFRLVAYADTDRDGKPDRLITQSDYLAVAKKGEWSSFTFTTGEKSIFVGMSWPRGSKTMVYYERLLWPDDLFPETMFYRAGPTAPIAAPVLTNMRLRFLKNGE
ncbi:MAG: glycosyltransferase family 39 protein [Candidatus Euphemobacter frigidus]|nr:glycosyltransferase family 39 protein [Candidatus Euphemobacter frigidus]